MFRLWGKVIKDNRLLKDIVISDDDPSHTRTQRIFGAVEEISRQFDLPVPIWLDANIKDIKSHKKTRFRADNYIEEPDFDYLEIIILEECCIKAKAAAPLWPCILYLQYHSISSTSAVSPSMHTALSPISSGQYASS